jgi:MFS family permease
VRRIPLGALEEREFRLFFTGQLVSLLGDAVTPFALAWAVLDLTGSARDLGFVIAAKTAPLVIFLLVGGVFADRLPRRGVMLTADVARMAIQAATAALLLSHTARIWELIVLQAFAGAGTAFFNPASTGLTPMTVSAGRLQEANALRGMSMGLTSGRGTRLPLMRRVSGSARFTSRACTCRCTSACRRSRSRATCLTAGATSLPVPGSG